MCIRPDNARDLIDLTADMDISNEVVDLTTSQGMVDDTADTEAADIWMEDCSRWICPCGVDITEREFNYTGQCRDCDWFDSITPEEWVIVQELVDLHEAYMNLPNYTTE